MAVTMQDVAKEAGVSVVTVSRALNNKPDIHPKTKEKVLAACKKLNYSPNVLARSLRTKRTHTIGVIIHSIGDPYFGEILQGISRTCKAKNYDVLLSVLSGHGCDVEEEIRAIRTLVEKQVDGLLLQPEQEDERYIDILRDIKVPFVFWNRLPKGFECDYVTNNHRAGSFLAVNHLIEMGYEPVYYLVRVPRTTTVRARIEGCFDAARAHGLGDDFVRVVEIGFTIDDAYETTKRLIESKEIRPGVGVYVWNDLRALGVAKALRESGMEIPEDVGLVGYNDSETARFFHPPLTSVRQQTFRIGEIAAEVLLEKLSREEWAEPKRIALEPELIVRDSSRRRPAPQPRRRREVDSARKGGDSSAIHEMLDADRGSVGPASRVEGGETNDVGEASTR